ncbi:MAG: 4-hydroxy-tetrahydrodipicolinate reductase [Planctomycetes bacterium GWF2_41_51]|nr:MAG: 4-hydroxy-tetrahydrodipicolinate reductase [Planctomycetes bacterium GWF2_41_51]HBG27548.1 4-hydroxy-tetrahydrodipicolinate reductase [Phycisphaerales bacterium]
MSSKLIIVGAAGRMGKRIAALALESKNFEIFGAVEGSTCPDLGKNFEQTNIKITSDFPAGADVVIDFSLPVAFEGTINYCLKTKCALVLGTTGLSPEQIKKVDDAAKTIPVIQATNMSVGMNLLFDLVGKVAQKLGDEYDIEIVEAHHRFKKDAPSGSAMTLAEKIAIATDKKFPDCLDVSRNGKEALRKKGSIGMQALRLGDTVGEHSVMFGTLGETVTISHSAHSRDTFAVGAVRAAQWLIGKKPARYTMPDVLGLK